jgi:hypothetical protein
MYFLSWIAGLFCGIALGGVVRGLIPDGSWWVRPLFHAEKRPKAY